MSRSASVADDAAPISAAETNRLFGGLQHCPALVLAVSGGPDSTALMVLAARWRGRRSSPRLVAVTVDHGLRKQAQREAKAVAALARQLGIEHRTLRWTGRKPKTALMEAARLARYRLLTQAARAVDAGYVLTAHTLDDQAETLLFRMARGSGLQGLAGMYERAPMPIEDAGGVMLVRPFLGLAKARLVATLKACRTPYFEDPSNRDPRFTRSRLRELMPMLAREGLTASRLAQLACRVQRAEDALAEVVAYAHARVMSDPRHRNGPLTLDAGVFADLPQEIALRVLRRAIAGAGGGPPALGKLEALYWAMQAPLAAHRLSHERNARFRRTLGGAVVTLAGGGITVEPAPPRRHGRPAKSRLTT
ncbi:MAG: tRNA lysidine(34) synthetase TilS [Hyphomicrobiales bacterium]|nr:tRNA lysidine(34) synthetase TilS [Hyphomicrobiales bacterium]